MRVLPRVSARGSRRTCPPGRLPIAEEHRAEQRDGDADHGGHVLHHGGDQGDEGRGDGEVQAQVLKTRNAGAHQHAGEGEEVPGDIERQAHAQGIPAIEGLAVVAAGEGEQLVGEQETQPRAPASRQRRNHRAHGHPVEQVLRGQQQGGNHDREEPGAALEHADGHQLRGAGEDNRGQALAVQRREAGVDRQGTGEQAPGQDRERQRHDVDGAPEEGA